MWTRGLILGIFVTCVCLFQLMPYCTAKSGALVEYWEMARVLGTQPMGDKQLPTINVTGLSADEIVEHKRQAATTIGCPTFTEEYKENARQQRQRSISPWKYVQNYDSRRPPGQRLFLDSVCLCDGCIDPISGLEVRTGLKSVGLKLPRNVSVLNATGQYEMSEINVQFGCHCVVQNTES